MTFTLPTDPAVPPVQLPGEDDPLAYALFRFYPSRQRARNVYLLNDGTTTETFPPALYNADGSLAQDGTEQIRRAFTGTGPHAINAEESALLEAAGYEVD